MRIPHLGPRDADKTGVIRGHDDATRTYKVQLETGKVVHGLTFEQMKVPYELKIKR